MAVELSIIIVNWNGGELLRHCIESVLQHPPTVPYEFIVVDNASTDQSLEWIRGCSLPNLRLIENAENLGFGKANNQGVRLSKARLIFFLNNDAEVKAGTIDRLIATLESNSRIAACGPRILNPDGTLQVSVWRNPITPWEMILTASKLHRLIPKRIRGELLLGSHWDHARRRRVDMLVGAAIMARRKVIEEVGGFDERLHMYCEDNEWCLRVVRSGWWLIFEPGAVVVHRAGVGTKQRWNEQERLRALSESKFLFHRVSLSRLENVANLATTCALLPLQLAWRTLLGRPRDEVMLLWRLHWDELKRVLQ